jgi:oligopeptide transport system ATP-binding protein
LENQALLKVQNLVMTFPVTKGLIIERKVADVKAVADVTFNIKKGETLGLVGESGSGKTTIGKCVLQLYKPTAGIIDFDGTDLCKLEGESLRKQRRRMQMIFQDPYSSLNPRMTVMDIVGEPLVVHKIATGDDMKERVLSLLELVGLRRDMAYRYPHMFSGGQRQRIGIARALSTRPEFLVCDEPVSALDVSIQSQIVNLMDDIRRELTLTLLFISHDLSMVRHISERIAVLYLGRIVELAPSEMLYHDPLHPYSRALLSAVPIPDPRVEHQRQRIILTGEIPSPLRPPSGCTFHPRCRERLEICPKESPPLIEKDGRLVACHLHKK